MKTLVWHLDKWNHLLLRQFYSRRLCDVNDRYILGRTPATHCEVCTGALPADRPYGAFCGPGCAMAGGR